jgi:hypothetical protein
MKMPLDARSVLCQVAVGDSRAGGCGHVFCAIWVLHWTYISFFLSQDLLLFQDENLGHFSRLEIWSPTRPVLQEESYDFDHQE